MLLGGAWLLAACVSAGDTYTRAYDGCDREAGACYADCRVLEDEARRAACQQRCSASVNRCFAQAREEATRYAGYRSAPDVAFYGRYGAWDPYIGYRFGPHGRRYSYRGYAYDRYGYDRWGYDRYGFDRRGYDYHGYRRRPRGAVIGSGAITRNGSGVPTQPATPRLPEDGRYVTEDGSVFAEDGRRLRYGGERVPRERPRSNGVRPTGRTGDPTVTQRAPAKPASPTARPRPPRAEPPRAEPRAPRAEPRRSRPRAAPRVRSRTAPRTSPRGGDVKRQLD